jgi:hypothetical protein
MSVTPDPENIVALAQEESWAQAWQRVHEAAEALDADDRLAWAASTLADATFERVEDGPMNDDLADALERLVLMHSGGLYHVSGDRFQTAIARLVAYHHAQDRLDTARRYARFCPSAPPCAAVLEGEASAGGLQRPEDVRRDGDAPDADRESVDRREIEHDASEQVSVTVTTPLSSADRTTGLFRSPLEKAFFHAVRDVFPTYTPYPNVALKSVVDAGVLKPYLTGEERSLLYTALVDCVLFDAQADFRPVAFFELDSTHHDAPDRRENDARKDRILALAGHRLYRIRPHEEPDRETLRHLLRNLPIDLTSR